MKFRNAICRRCAWINLPSSILVVLLQRTPALRLATATGEFLAGSPAGAILRSVAGAVAALGALDSLAGATQYTLTSNYPSPHTVSTGSQIAVAAFGVSPIEMEPSFWRISGSIPPGLDVTTVPGSPMVTSDSGPETINGSTPYLEGTPTAAGTYTIYFQAFLDSNTSSSALPYTVIVNGPTVTAPAITTQPQTQTVTAGNPVTFSVAATGSPLSFQWYFDGTLISGAGADTYTIAAVQPSNAGQYSVIVYNTGGTVTSPGSVTSAPAILTVSSDTSPAFTVQPNSVTVATGATVVFNAAASGSPAPAYQWYLNGSSISGATLSSLVLGNGAEANAAATPGTYTCTASNAAGTATSAFATLSVISTVNPGRLINIATRAQVGTGTNVLIAGFVIGGAGTAGLKPVLIRGSGPALAALGVSGTLPDPALSLYASGGSTAFESDTGWGGSPTIKAEAAAVGAFAWSTTPVGADSALFPPNGGLAPGPYTAEIAGASGDSGVALAEVYDATPAGSYTASTPRLINLASRALVGTGANIMIAGFVAGGATSRTVLIRASGPAISGLVSGALPDPQLQLYSTSTSGVSSLIAGNSGWGGAAAIVGAAASVGAFSWTNPQSADSALLLTLPPGNYSAQVSGASGDTGLSLVEVYEVP